MEISLWWLVVVGGLALAVWKWVDDDWGAWLSYAGLALLALGIVFSRFLG